MLLSKAEEDWRGQLRALRHAEYLIRAAPDELEQYAGGWAVVRWLQACRALVGSAQGQQVAYVAAEAGKCCLPTLPRLGGCAHTHPAVSSDALACATALSPDAVPLARALVHTKVPGWMDEEMPQEGPPANMQRFR
jgi:hypothetical protein